MTDNYNVTLGMLHEGSTLQDAQNLDKQNRAQGRKTNFVQLFKSMDKNKDGMLSKEEVQNYVTDQLEKANKKLETLQGSYKQKLDNGIDLNSFGHKKPIKNF